MSYVRCTSSAARSCRSGITQHQLDVWFPESRSAIPAAWSCTRCHGNQQSEGVSCEQSDHVSTSRHAPVSGPPMALVPPLSSPRAARAPTRRRHRPRNSCLLPSSHQSTNNHPPLVCVCVLPSWSRDHYSAGIGTPFYSAAGLHQPVY